MIPYVSLTSKKFFPLAHAQDQETPMKSIEEHRNMTCQ
jgi:hypothetical protein